MVYHLDYPKGVARILCSVLSVQGGKKKQKKEKKGHVTWHQPQKPWRCRRHDPPFFA